MKARLAIAAYLLLACYVSAQTRRVSVESVSPLTIKAGTVAAQATQISIQPGSHVNSNKPRGEFLIPFKLEWEAVGGLTMKSQQYPKAEEIEVGPDKLLVFTGSFPVITEFQAVEGAKTGSLEVKGKLHYQACNSQMCFRPATTDVVLPVTIQ